MKQPWLGIGSLAVVLGFVAAAVACDGTTLIIGQPNQPSAPDAARGSRALGEACIAHSECASGICVVVSEGNFPDGGSAARSVCSEDCSAQTDCLAGWNCGPLGERTGSVCLCRPSYVNSMFPEPCDGRDNDCNGIVDDPEPSDRWCAGPVEGSLFRAPPGGAACRNGSCSCLPPGTGCSEDGVTTACVDLQTDPRNCGACGKTCSGGTTCVAGECQCGTEPATAACAPDPISTTSLCTSGGCLSGWGVHAPVPAFDLALSGDLLFFTVRYVPGGVTPGLYRMPKSGGASTRIGPQVGTLAVDGASIVTAGDVVASCTAPDCGSPVTLDGRTAAIGERRVTTFGGTAYWTTPDRAVLSCPVTGCATPTVVLPAGGTASMALTVDASGVYILRSAPDSTWTGWVARGGQPATPFLDGMNTGAPHAVATDTDHIYWATEGGVWRCPKNGCAGAIAPYTTTMTATELLVDGTRVYWAGFPLDESCKLCGCPGGVYACPREGCTAPTPLSSVFTTLRSDATSLYGLFYAAPHQHMAIGRVPK